MSFVSAAISGGSALVGGGIKLISGLSQKNKGNQLLNQIGDSPTMAIPNEVLQNQQQAQLNANSGLPSEQYKQAMQNIQRQQATQLSRANDRRGGLAVLASGQDAANQGLLNLDVANANARLKNQNTLYGINNNVASWKNKVWQNNVKDPWNRKYQYGMSLLGAGNQNVTTGADQIGAGGISAANSLNRSGFFGNDNNYSNPAPAHN